MKNKIIYGILIFFLIISDFVYINAFVSGGFIPNDVSNDPSNIIIPLLFLINVVSLIIGFTKINKHKSIAIILIILSLPTLISAVWMYTHKNDFNPRINRMVKANLANARAQIEYNYNSNINSYLNACEDNGVVGILNAIERAGVETKCFSDKDSFVLAAELISKPKKNDLNYGYDYYCVDSIKNTKSITTLQYQSIVNADTLCSQE